MLSSSAPRHYLSAPAPMPLLPDVGMPQERLARIAARRTFVEMKHRFVDGISKVPGSRGDWLRYQVRQAQEPVDLWLLRGAVFSVLRDGGKDYRRTRLDLHRALDNVFPDHGQLLPFVPTL